MSTATLPGPATGTSHGALRPAPMPDPAAADRSLERMFLRRYTVTLLPVAAGLIALELGGSAAGFDGGWPEAIAITAGWTLAVAAWLRHRGWTTGTLAAVAAGPAAAPAISAGAGWLTPAGLLFWGPVSMLLTVALALGARPLPPAPRGEPVAALATHRLRNELRAVPRWWPQGSVQGHAEGFADDRGLT